MSPEEEKAIDVVRRNRQEKEPINISVRNKIAGFDGTVYFVHWTSKTEGRDHDTLSYFPAGSDDGVFLWTGEDSIKYFSHLKPASHVEKLARGIFGFSGISAIIALLITATICYLALNSATEIPAILANALTTILGFFFGSQVGRLKG